MFNAFEHTFNALEHKNATKKGKKIQTAKLFGCFLNKIRFATSRSVSSGCGIITTSRRHQGHRRQDLLHRRRDHRRRQDRRLRLCRMRG